MFLAFLTFAGIYRRLDFQHDLDRLDQGWGMAFQPFFAKRQVGSFKSVERNGFSLRCTSANWLGQYRCRIIDQLSVPSIHLGYRISAISRSVQRRSERAGEAR